VIAQRDLFVDIALDQVGVLDYSARGDRCDWSKGSTDCSGLVAESARRAGLNVGCMASWQIAYLCHDAVRPAWMTRMFGPGRGTQLTALQAVETRGAIALHGAWEGRFGFGNLGHAKISLGKLGRSVEAVGKNVGVAIWTFIDPKNSYYALLPGMGGFEKLGENTMFVQLHHYNPDGKIIGWAHPPVGHENEKPVVRVSDDGLAIEAWWGASIYNDQPVDSSHPMVRRRWISPARPLIPGTRYTGVAYTDPDDTDGRPGGVAIVSDGTTRHFHLS